MRDKATEKQKSQVDYVRPTLAKDISSHGRSIMRVINVNQVRWVRKELDRVKPE